MGRKKLTKKQTVKALFLVEAKLWKAFKAKCKKQGWSASSAIRGFIELYLNEGD